VLETGYGFGGTLPDGLVRDAAAGREVGKDCGGWHRGSGSGVQEMDAGFRIWRDIAEGNGIGGKDAWVEDMEGGNHKIGKDVFSTGLQPLSISSTEITVCYNRKFFGGEGKNLAE
jgi:hypothetical protein